MQTSWGNCGNDLGGARLLDPRLQKVGRRHESLILAHAVKGRGVSKRSAQNMVLDALPLERSDGLEFLVVFRLDVDRKPWHAKRIVDHVPRCNICGR